MKRRPHTNLQRRSRAVSQVVAATLTLLLLMPPTAGAWSDRGRQIILDRAVETLPYPLRAFFEANHATISRLAADPKQWGDEVLRPENDFIHLDAYGRYPFADLPRDYNAAVRKFTRKKLLEQGVLPWQIGTYSLKLEEAFRDQHWDKVKLYAAILAYYVAEAHDPFNTTSNNKGQLSDQPGVDQRYGKSLVDRYQMFFIIRPGGAYKIDDPTQHAFGIVIEAHTWVDNILLADSQARSGKIDYNDEYYDAFYEAAGAVLIRQLTNGSQNVGSYWYTAWVNAGRPSLPAD